MKKIDAKKSLFFDRGIDSLKESLDHLNEEGFFSDFKDFSQYKEGVLKSVIMGEDIGYPYTCKGDNGYKYFLPKSLAVFEEPEEKKYRPYMYLSELPFKVGDVIRYRGKQCCSECKGLVSEIECQNNDTCELDNLIIGGINATPQELFNNYELLDDNCQYKPFGVATTYDNPYLADTGNCFFQGFKYYIPLNKANFVDDKNNLRPFKSIFELMQKTGCSIGDVITIRREDNAFIYEETCVLNGYRTVSSSQGVTDTILLGATSYTFEELMNDCKYWKDGEWQPFGIEE